MSLISLLGLTAVLAAIGGMVEIFVPVYTRMRLVHPEDNVVAYPKLFAFITFLVFLVVFPVIILALLFPGMKQSMVDNFYLGVSGEA